MKIGFRTARFREVDLADALTSLGDLGFDGVELCLENHGLRPDLMAPETAGEVGGSLAGAGLELASVSYHADGEDLSTRVPNTFKAIELTRQLGATVLILNVERTDPERRDAQWGEAVARLRQACARGEELGVDLAMEPEPGLLVHGMAEFARLKQDVASDRLKLNLDIGHCHITDDLVPSILGFAADLVHVHFEDVAHKVHDHLVPGDGDMDLPAVVEALKKVGYTGYLTVDLFRITDDPVRYARRSLAAMRNLLAP